MRKPSYTGLPPAQGLYRPEFEHDSCGVGFVAHIKGKRSHKIIEDADHLLCRMDHRGARGAEPNTGDGAGMVTALPHEFLARVAKDAFGVALPAPGKFAAGVVFLPHGCRRARALQGGRRFALRRGRPTARRLACRADGCGCRGSRPRRPCRSAAHRAAIRCGRRARRRRGVRAQALSDTQAREPPAARRHEPAVRRSNSTSAACRRRFSSTKAC